MHINARDITFRYDREPVFTRLSVEIRPGDFVGIAGPNGTGKSTLLRLMARILSPREGTLFLNGRSYDSIPSRELARSIGYVPQESPWLFPFTVMEVVLMGRVPFRGKWGFETREDIDRCREALELTDIALLADKPVTAISGGERQRVLIARALAQDPGVLLLDEPNVHLDLSHQLDIFRILRRQHEEQQRTVVCVSHDLNLAAMFSTRILLLMRPGNGRGNEIVADGPPEEVLTEILLRRVFQTDVLVDQHPLASRPRVSLNPSSRIYHQRNP